MITHEEITNVEPLLSVEYVIEYLNSLLDCDAAAISLLVEARELCNEALAAHDSCQVLEDNDTKATKVGLLGIVNGMFGVLNGRGIIEAEYDDDDTLIARFSITDEFERWNEDNNDDDD